MDKEFDLMLAQNALQTVRQFINGRYTTDTSMEDLEFQEIYWSEKILKLTQEAAS